MSKLYKIPTIGAFVRDGRLLEAVSSTEIGRAMQRYYEDPRFHVDMQDKSSRGFREWPLEKWVRLAEVNPIHFLDRSSSFFQYDQINRQLRLAPAVAARQSSSLIAHMEDILRCRERSMVARLYKRNSE